MATEIGMDLKLFSTKTVCGLMKEATAIGSGNGALARLEDSVRSLEEEKRKIEVFKRELPLCMHLLTDVIEGLKNEVEQCRGERFSVGYEEFMPRKSNFKDVVAATPEPDGKDKVNWMSSFQLWSNSSSATEEDDEKKLKRITEERIATVESRPEKETLLLDSKSRGSGAFVPFKGLSTNSKEEKPALSLPDLSLLSSPVKSAPHLVSAIIEDHHVSGPAPGGVGRVPMSSAVVGAHLILQAQQQPQRKARRCWSPELHRRFVLALQHLGGAQVATPKQIRELMKVDGLTNDEVKSHLQKYRLHSRRAPNVSSNVNQPVVMVEGLWFSPENYSSSSQQSISKSGSPRSPLQLVCSNQTRSTTAGDSCEEEGGRSESYS